MIRAFYSNGKLLLTGEYAILDSAVGLALPTTYGQTLHVDEVATTSLHWQSFDHNKAIWFKGHFDLNTLTEIDRPSSNEENQTSKTLEKILLEARKLNPSFLKGKKGYQVKTYLGFPRDWGLGSSSTLINNIAEWAKVDAYALLRNAFSGSGYDIACAQHNTPILYSLKDGRPEIEEVEFKPNFKDKLYFVHLNKKQSSREGIAQYRNRTFNKTKLIEKVSSLTQELLSAASLPEFENLVGQHETLLSETLHLPKVKDLLFPDYQGAVKSLGAWGGDFVLATGNDGTPHYFKEKGYNIVIPFSKMIL